MPKFIVSLLLLFALLAIFIHSWMQLIAYIGILSTLAFLLFGIDKFCARKGCRRVPEAALLILCFAGGAAGALAGQLVFRHKTRKPYLNRGIAVIFLIQLLVIAVLFILF